MDLYPHGTRVIAEGGGHVVEGRLIGDHDTLDGSVYVLTDQDEALILNGWLFTFEIVALPPPRRAPPRPTVQAPTSPSKPHTAPRPKPGRPPWCRPWYLRNE